MHVTRESLDNSVANSIGCGNRSSVGEGHLPLNFIPCSAKVAAVLSLKDGREAGRWVDAAIAQLDQIENEKYPQVEVGEPLASREGRGATAVAAAKLSWMVL